MEATTNVTADAVWVEADGYSVRIPFNGTAGALYHEGAESLEWWGGASWNGRTIRTGAKIGPTLAKLEAGLAKLGRKVPRS